MRLLKFVLVTILPVGWYFEKWKNKSFLILDLSIAIPQYKLTLAKGI